MKLATIGKLALTVIANQCLPLSLITQERKSISLYQPWLIKTNTFIYTHIYICTHSGIHIYYFFKMLYFCYILNTSESFSFPLFKAAQTQWSSSKSLICSSGRKTDVPRFNTGFDFSPPPPRSPPSKKVHSTWSLLNSFFFVKWEGIRIYGVKV